MLHLSSPPAHSPVCISPSPPPPPLRLLAATLQPGSQLARCAQQDVAAFLAGREGRHKGRCPDLGVLLVKLLLVPREAVPWAAFAPIYVQECLARQVGVGGGSKWQGGIPFYHGKNVPTSTQRPCGATSSTPTGS